LRLRRAFGQENVEELMGFFALAASRLKEAA
jgi:hypothetical protein